MMRCTKLQIGTKQRSNARQDAASVTTNDNSPGSCKGQPAADHSTPVARKPITNADAEDSPDLDYSPSPILPPYTQEGGNEVAWDWQSSLSRSPESRNRKQNVECETPKRTTKLLQRKRNSNSPLLYKPRKRKIETLIKRENIENIGQFSAELQALNERIIKEHDKNHSSVCVKEEDAPTSTNTSGREATSETKDDKRDSVGEGGNERNSVGETNDNNVNVDNERKKETSGNYDDLFDDSVDEDMIKCTQEIEERFNLLDKENPTLSQVKNEESGAKDATDKTFVQSGSSENSKKPLLVRGTLGDNNTLKTYSRLSIRRDGNSSISLAAQRGKDEYKPCPNNNNTIHSPDVVKEPCDTKRLAKNTLDLFDIPDDSFDDWFTACDEKSFPSSKNRGDSTKVSYKCLTNAPLKSETKSADSLESAAKSEASNVFANRKFFKTKSLSEQSVNRGASTNAKGINRSGYSARTTHPSSFAHTSVARASVSTKPIVMNDRKVESNAISLIRGADRTRGSDVNRCAVKSDGDRFVKHHSTGNMKSDAQETTKTGSQPTRCTPEEIERKRLQAVARLEAKRKLLSTKTTSNVNR